MPVVIALQEEGIATLSRFHVLSFYRWKAEQRVSDKAFKTIKQIYSKLLGFQTNFFEDWLLKLVPKADVVAKGALPKGTPKGWVLKWISSRISLPK